MTGHQIDNFVGSLVEMAKAFEERPRLERQITDLQSEISRLSDANVALDGSNAILRSHIDELNAKITEVTKERDDVGFRHLEEVDKTNALLLAIRNAMGSLTQAVAVVDPPKAAEPIVEQSVGNELPVVTSQSATASATTELPSANVDQAVAGTSEASNTGATQSREGEQASVGERVADPTENVNANTGAIQNSAGQSSVTHSDAGSTNTETSPTDKPYAGRRYSDVTKDGYSYPTYSEWLDLGGDYNGWHS